MSMEPMGGLQRSATTDEANSDCDECEKLPDGWPCAECYIQNGVEIRLEEYDG